MAILDHSNTARARSVHSHMLYKRETPVASDSAAVTATVVVSEGVESPVPSSSTSRTVRDGLTGAEKGMVAVIVLVGVGILSFVAWRIGKKRRQKVRAASSKFNVALRSGTQSEKPIAIDFDRSGNELEKPSMTILLPQTPAISVTRSSTSRPWTHTIPIEVPTFPSEKSGALTSVSTQRPTDDAMGRSPPPSYAFANGLFTSPPSISSYRIPPPVLEIPSRPLSGNIVVPSPRSASFGVDSPLYQKAPLTALRAKSGLATANRPLPRMMIVESTFKPSLSDELLVRLGETLKMLEEYEDEWCLVQRGDDMNPQKGVVPRFCLKEQD